VTELAITKRRKVLRLKDIKSLEVRKIVYKCNKSQILSTFTLFPTNYGVSSEWRGYTWANLCVGRKYSWSVLLC